MMPRWADDQTADRRAAVLDALQTLSRGGVDVTAGEVARFCGHDAAGVRYQLDALVREGLVQRRSEKHPRRRYRKSFYALAPDCGG